MTNSLSSQEFDHLNNSENSKQNTPSSANHEYLPSEPVFPKRILTEEERLANKQRKEMAKTWCNEHGIIRREIYLHDCHTTPDYIENLIRHLSNQLIQQYDEFKGVFKFDLELEGLTKRFVISFSPLGYFGKLGLIQVIPLNEHKTLIEVVCNGGLAPFMEPEDGEKLYWLAFRFLILIAQEFSTFYGGEVNSHDEKNRTHMKRKRVRGRIPTPVEDKLRIINEWEKVRGKIKQVDFCNNHGICDSTLRQWMKELEE